MEIARDKNNNHMQAVVIDTTVNVRAEDSPFKIPEGLCRFAAKEDTEFWIEFQDLNHVRPMEQDIFMPAGSVEYFYVYEGQLTITHGSLNIMETGIKMLP